MCIFLFLQVEDYIDVQASPPSGIIKNAVPTAECVQTKGNQYLGIFKFVTN